MGKNRCSPTVWRLASSAAPASVLATILSALVDPDKVPAAVVSLKQARGGRNKWRSIAHKNSTKIELHRADSKQPSFALVQHTEVIYTHSETFRSVILWALGLTFVAGASLR